MIYLDLLLAFLKVGCFSFGGYAAIPIVRDTVVTHGWMEESAFADMIAISESTPGPIMVNMATYIGNKQGGIPGAVIATAAVVLPAFLIILLLMKFVKNALKKEGFQAAVRGIKPAVVGMIFATGVFMAINNLFPSLPAAAVDWKALCLTSALALIYFGAKKVFKHGLSPIVLILIAGAFGTVLYGF